MTSLCQIDSNRIIVGDSAGYMHTLDLRRISNKHGRSISANVGRFNGPAGSVRQIVKHENLPIVACVGLDRMLRTYDVNKRKQLDCVYLKQRLNCMLFCADGTWDINDDEEADQEFGTSDGNGDPLPMIEGNIDDEDEVEDYVDSSAEEDGSDDDDTASSSNKMEDESQSEDEELSTTSEKVENDRKQKKRRRH